MISVESHLRLRNSIYITLAFVAFLWLVKVFEMAFEYDLGVFGILPRTIKGSLGIITGPLVHGDVYHLLSNTFPILILGIGIIYFYNSIAIEVIALIYLMTGFWVWVAAREGAYHIGASGLVYGLLSFLLVSGFIRRDSKTLAISFVVFFLYGGSLFSGFTPTTENVSWESHILGAVAGIFCAVYFRNARSSVYLDQQRDENGLANQKDHTHPSDIWSYGDNRTISYKYKIKDVPPKENDTQDNEPQKPIYTLTINTSPQKPTEGKDE